MIDFILWLAIFVRSCRGVFCFSVFFLFISKWNANSHRHSVKRSNYVVKIVEEMDKANTNDWHNLQFSISTICFGIMLNHWHHMRANAKSNRVNIYKRLAVLV